MKLGPFGQFPTEWRPAGEREKTGEDEEVHLSLLFPPLEHIRMNLRVQVNRSLQIKSFVCSCFSPSLPQWGSEDQFTMELSGDRLHILLEWLTDHRAGRARCEPCTFLASPGGPKMHLARGNYICRGAPHAIRLKRSWLPPATPCIMAYPSQRNLGVELVQEASTS